MKSKVILPFTLIILFSLSFSASGQVNTAQIGKWTFEAPNAPEEFNYGVIEFKKDSVLMQFTDSQYKLSSNWVKVKNDSIKYESSVDDTPVLFSLKVVDKQKISGNAVWEGGETPMILTRKK